MKIGADCLPGICLLLYDMSELKAGASSSLKQGRTLAAMEDAKHCAGSARQRQPFWGMSFQVDAVRQLYRTGAGRALGGEQLTELTNIVQCVTPISQFILNLRMASPQTSPHPGLAAVPGKLCPVKNDIEARLTITP
jgi:hypothetical protein